VAEEQTEHREEDQQQRKDREHAVVGEESGEVGPRSSTYFLTTPIVKAAVE